jgi:sirohydrochlorin ferrochelatase
MKTALLVLVHGSPRPVANEAMFRVVEEVKTRGVFDHVQVGFMECNEPTIPDGVDACAAAGAERVVAVPYFLHTGTHVADDLPTLLEEAQERHPHIQFQMGRYIGASPLLTDILAQRALAASEG